LAEQTRICAYCLANADCEICGECGLSCGDAEAARKAITDELLSPEGQERALAAHRAQVLAIHGPMNYCRWRYRDWRKVAADHCLDMTELSRLRGIDAAQRLNDHEPSVILERRERDASGAKLEQLWLQLIQEKIAEGANCG
jgi:hypothetical protein